MFLGKGVLEICSKFTGEHPCRSAISIKLQSNYIEIALRHECSPVNLLHIFRTPFPKNTFGGLLLYTKWKPREKFFILKERRYWLPELFLIESFCQKLFWINLFCFLKKLLFKTAPTSPHWRFQITTWGGVFSWKSFDRPFKSFWLYPTRPAYWKATCLKCR